MTLGSPRDLGIKPARLIWLHVDEVGRPGDLVNPSAAVFGLLR